MTIGMLLSLSLNMPKVSLSIFLITFQLPFWHHNNASECVIKDAGCFFFTLLKQNKIQNNGVNFEISEKLNHFPFLNNF
jgi:hypothetical protein